MHYIHFALLASLSTASHSISMEMEESLPSMTWIWGRGVPMDAPRGTVAERFPSHGIVKIEGNQEMVKIDLVKRPPRSLFPLTTPFCSNVLPVAILQFVATMNIDLPTVHRMEVLIDASPAPRACRCYLRTMALLGFTRINGIDWSRNRMEEFCSAVPDLEPVLVVALRSSKDMVEQSSDFTMDMWIALGTASSVFELNPMQVDASIPT